MSEKRFAPRAPPNLEQQPQPSPLRRWGTCEELLQRSGRAPAGRHGEQSIRQTVNMAEREPSVKVVGLSDSASPSEAAAMIAALERFMRETAPPPCAPDKRVNPWRRAALLEGVSNESDLDVPDSWINA